MQHIWEAIRFENTDHARARLRPRAPDPLHGDMLPWYTGKPCERAKRSHINFCVYDSTWEASEAFELDRDPHVAAWVKNDHLGFEITTSSRACVRKYRPDFLIRLTNGKMLVLEVKGQSTIRTARSASSWASGSRRSMSTADLAGGRARSHSARRICRTF